MRRRKRGERIHGPYKHRQRWRIVVISPSGERDTHSFETKEQAQAVIRDARAQVAAEGVTVTAALDAYEQHQRDRGSSAGHVRTTRHRLDALFAGALDDELWSVTPARARMLYAALAKRQATDTHRNTLGQARTFGRWAAKQGWLRRDPFAAVEGKGKRKAGKPQLRIDEARQLVATALELVAGGDAGALATLLALLLNMRASEIARVVPRDVDDGGRLLWIDVAKSAAGRRALEVPEVLREPLRTLTPALGRDRSWVYRHVKRVAAAAGLENVTPHGLRGTHASLARAAGVTGPVVAASLGHSSPAVTDRHYARDEARRAGATKTVLKLVG